MKKRLSHSLTRFTNLPGFDWVVLAVALCIFGLLTFHTITASGIWFDEAFSAYITQYNFLDIARYTATDVHPPLYYWILNVWTELFGTSELAFRSLSVFFGMVTISFGFLLVKRLFGRKAAWITLLLLMLSPMLIRYSQEARMYTLAAAISLAATYTLTFAVQSKRRLPWVVYGILVSLGMWTHYFTALVWLAHWAWRAVVVWQTGARRKQFKKAFFTKQWMLAHIVAVGVFLPWIPFMLVQLTVIQVTGFWIGPVSADTLTNYMTNVLFYLEHDQAQAIYPYLLGAILTILGVLAVKVYRSLEGIQKQWYMLILAVAFVPVLLLFLLSVPPLKSSFVERYLVPSAVGFALFAGVTLTLGTVKLKSLWRAMAVVLVAAAMVLGITNVYAYGNYNKNNNVKVNTGAVMKEIIERAQPGEPIIAATPWIFYEAIFYATDDHPVYFIDRDVEYIYGSLDMLKYSDNHKINDLDAFVRDHPVVWYVGSSDGASIGSPESDWVELQRFSIYDQIAGKDPYKAVQFQTN